MIRQNYRLNCSGTAALFLVFSTLSLISTLQVAHATAFSPGVVGDPAARALRAELGATRLIGANTVDGLWAGGASGVSALLAPALPGDGVLFAQSLAHSTESVVIRGDRALTGWRDPLTDVWLLGEWSRKTVDGQIAWQLQRTTLALTRDLDPARGKTTTAALPLFPDAGKIGFSAAIVKAHHDAVAAFRRAGAGNLDALPWGKDVRAARAREIALQRLDAARLARRALAKTAPDAAQVVNVALVEETPAVQEVSDSIARGLAALPTEVRLSLRIVSAVPARGRVLAVVQSALQPASVYVAHLQGAGDDIHLVNVESIDLARAE